MTTSQGDATMTSRDLFIREAKSAGFDLLGEHSMRRVVAVQTRRSV